MIRRFCLKNHFKQKENRIKKLIKEIVLLYKKIEKI